MGAGDALSRRRTITAARTPGPTTRVLLLAPPVGFPEGLGYARDRTKTTLSLRNNRATGRIAVKTVVACWVGTLATSVDAVVATFLAGRPKGRGARVPEEAVTEVALVATRNAARAARAS